jgi:uncharacterized protein (TIGR03435 family)
VKTIALAVALTTGLVLAPLPARAQSAATFEVASIKPSAPESAASPLPAFANVSVLPDGGIRTTNTALRDLIRFAYDVEPDQITGASGWQLTSRFDVTTRVAAGSAISESLVRERTRSLLAERFKLKAHVESRETSVSALVVASKDGKLGPNLKPTTTDCTAAPNSCRAFVGPAGGRFTPGTPLQMSIRGVGIPLSQLAKTVGQSIGARVVDRTGLTGLWDFETEIVMDPQLMSRLATQAGVTPAGGAAAPDSPSMSSILQQRLGLKLEAQKAPVPYVIIDAAELPTAD